MKLLAAGFGGVVAEEEAGTFDGAPVFLIEIGMLVGAVMVDDERKICDLVPLLQEHLLIESLDLVQRLDRFGRQSGQTTVRLGRAVEILGAAEDSEAITLCDRSRVPVQEHAVGLEVDDASRLHERAVTLQEER